MSVNLTVNGATFAYPETSDNNWGPDATDWATAVTSGMLQKAGGVFTLLAEVDFGTTYGLKSAYVKSRAANPASDGVLRLARPDVVSWRNEANDGDLDLSVDSSNRILFNGQFLVESANSLTANRAVITDGGGGLDISTTTSAEISYVSGVTSSIQNQLDAKQIAGNYITDLTGDVTASGPGSVASTITPGIIVNAMISASAAIDYSKLASLTASRALQSSVGGVVGVSSVTSTELGYVSGVTSAIQTQLDSKQVAGNYITALTGDVVATGPGSVASAIQSGVITNVMINASAAIALTKLAALNTGILPVTNGSGFIVSSVVTATTAGVIGGVTALDVDNIKVDGNTVSATNSNGNVNLSPNGTGSVVSSTALQLPEISTPATPSSGNGKIYFKTDGIAYSLNDSGTETPLTSNSASSGTYTPTLTNVTNVATSGAYVTQWSRVGNTVTVGGVIDIDPTLAATLTEVGMSLPVASNFASFFQAGGSFASGDGTPENGRILADATNDRVTFRCTPTSAAARSYGFTVVYLVI